MPDEDVPPCERFTVLDSRREEISRCDVCDQLESAHDVGGRRILSGGEIEALRRRMLVETFEKREQERPHRDGST
ncbi:MAG TPA: hypothetical protein VMA36_07550 [Candidatus Limnocylindria bacterium]|jgi:hypothetical protein|nr:hypothetical protein [Candidatus Limnocylindria bacterium]